MMGLSSKKYDRDMLQELATTDVVVVYASPYLTLKEQQPPLECII